MFVFSCFALDVVVVVVIVPRVKAHVMVLSFEGAQLGEIGQWTPWLKDSVFVYLYCIKVCLAINTATSSLT